MFYFFFQSSEKQPVPTPRTKRKQLQDNQQLTKIAEKQPVPSPRTKRKQQLQDNNEQLEQQLTKTAYRKTGDESVMAANNPSLHQGQNPALSRQREYQQLLRQQQEQLAHQQLFQQQLAQQQLHPRLGKSSSLPLEQAAVYHQRIARQSSPHDSRQQLAVPQQHIPTNAHNVSQDSGLSPSPLDHPVMYPRVTPPIHQQQNLNPYYHPHHQQHHHQVSADEAFSGSAGSTPPSRPKKSTRCNLKKN